MPIGSIEVLDASGALVARPSIGIGQLGTIIDMSTLSNGHYLLKISHANASGSNTYRIVKQ